VNHSENASLSQYLLSPRRAYPILIYPILINGYWGLKKVLKKIGFQVNVMRSSVSVKVPVSLRIIFC